MRWVAYSCYCQDNVRCVHILISCDRNCWIISIRSHVHWILTVTFLWSLKYKFLCLLAVFASWFYFPLFFCGTRTLQFGSPAFRHHLAFVYTWSSILILAFLWICHHWSLQLPPLLCIVSVPVSYTHLDVYKRQGLYTKSGSLITKLV